MHCNEARRRLAKPGGASVADSELAEHLSECDACRDYARELRLAELLAEIPVRKPLPGMEERVLQRALGRKERVSPAGLHLRWALATAASVILAVVVTLQFYPSGAGREPAAAGMVKAAVVEVVPQQTHMVNVLLTSHRALNDALITVQLDDNLALHGYKDVHHLKWRASLKSGGNRLSLPVKLLQGNSGKITVTIEHGGKSKHFTINVTAAPESGSQKLSMI
ncbi:MAG: hypothetical protein P8126_04400 [Gammaproteobacteria bacterium]|jgi:hypothetical protein